MCTIYLACHGCAGYAARANSSGSVSLKHGAGVMSSIMVWEIPLFDWSSWRLGCLGGRTPASAGSLPHREGEARCLLGGKSGFVLRGALLSECVHDIHLETADALTFFWEVVGLQWPRRGSFSIGTSFPGRSKSPRKACIGDWLVIFMFCLDEKGSKT